MRIQSFTNQYIQRTYSQNQLCQPKTVSFTYDGFEDGSDNEPSEGYSILDIASAIARLFGKKDPPEEIILDRPTDELLREKLREEDEDE